LCTSTFFVLRNSGVRAWLADAAIRLMYLSTPTFAFIDSIVDCHRHNCRTTLGSLFSGCKKYANGVNRIGSGRRFKIAEALGVPVSSFFEGADYAAGEPARLSPVAMLAEPCALRNLTAVREIADPELRRLLVRRFEKFVVNLNAPASRKPRSVGEPRGRGGHARTAVTSASPRVGSQSTQLWHASALKIQAKNRRHGMRYAAISDPMTGRTSKRNRRPSRSRLHQQSLSAL
jgi:hypothetical protein